jgi:pSer/pThr/pTyr-binding forkhead associated (FHA) protein
MSESDADQTTYMVGPAPRRVATVVITAPARQAGRSVTVGPAGVVMGRDATCDLVLPSEQVSRRHAAVRVRGDQYRAEDLNSLNGTSFNGRPFTGTVVLRDGDRLTLADVEVEFRLGASRSVPPTRSEPSAGTPWRPDAPTEPTGQVEPEPNGGSGQSLRQELVGSPGFTGGALALTVLGSVVGTVLVGFAEVHLGSVEVGQWGSLAGATIVPIVTATFTTKRAGEKGRVRVAAIVALSAIALAVTVSGVSAAEVVTQGRVTPGSANAMTFVPVPPNPVPLPDPDPSPTPTETASADPTATPGPGIEVTPSLLDCGTGTLGTTLTCGTVTIGSTGTANLEITDIELVDNPGDFAADETACEGTTLAPGQTCQFTVVFAPQVVGERSATVVIHQNLPPPDTGTAGRLLGMGAE